MLTIGIDVGGTKVKTALVDAKGQILVSHRHPTDAHQGPDGVIADLAQCVRHCLGKTARNASALGVGVAGQVDAASGVVRFAPNLHWRNVPLQSRLENLLGLPVVVINDVRAATWGEWSHGAGQGEEEVVCLFVGTGIGGGVISGGRLLEGYSGTAGEFGHMTIVVDGRPCHCRNLGCLEAYAGGWAIAERAQEAVQADPCAGQTLIAMAGGIEQITATTVGAAYRQGDPFARRLVEDTGHYLAAGLIGIVNSFNPHLLILGGGVIEGLPELIDRVEAEIRTRALHAAIEHVRIVKSSLGNNAGVLGAAALARETRKESR
ncbi:MAG: ROK family protein [Nitrospinota bacterium]|nr:MAG: ROK family protein [Nitrospinota bacterium]